LQALSSKGGQGASEEERARAMGNRQAKVGGATWRERVANGVVSPALSKNYVFSANGHAREVSGPIASRGLYSGPFPLTPILSPGEREFTSSRLLTNCGHSADDRRLALNTYGSKGCEGTSKLQALSSRGGQGASEEERARAMGNRQA